MPLCHYCSCGPLALWCIAAGSSRHRLGHDLQIYFYLTRTPEAEHWELRWRNLQVPLISRFCDYNARAPKGKAVPAMDILVNQKHDQLSSRSCPKDFVLVVQNRELLFNGKQQNPDQHGTILVGGFNLRWTSLWQTLDSHCREQTPQSAKRKFPSPSIPLPAAVVYDFFSPANST